jgi:hypothetical protein
LQNSPLESSCVVVALIENYSTSKPLKASPEKSHILRCDTVVANERYGRKLLLNVIIAMKIIVLLLTLLNRSSSAAGVQIICCLLQPKEPS